MTAFMVYPRVCGGSHLRPARRVGDLGLSPRVRGKRDDQPARLHPRRSIPACAGEARALVRHHPPVGVYPRVCGGSLFAPALDVAFGGLSLRVRGKHASTGGWTAQNRSIPACAGEACVASPARCGWRVYPRVCGGSRSIVPARRLKAGLSPRVRGKRFSFPAIQPSSRSIPACAGEARNQGHRYHLNKVYPRVCGGSEGLVCPYPDAAGLSPRVRGKLGVGQRIGYPEGSIPACAGEARHQPPPDGYESVYPRVCGGSVGGSDGVNGVAGLSPRVRGKPTDRGANQRRYRSIPACAGEAV